ncbi:alpha/beta fold hydrolase [Streptomyces sp. NPDC050560]|uniref:alpha/beta fold hydrolase n=1 Tax=Streptomyces sp. NPDC050560 TaxID=3365630 RepID=UPI0037A6BC2E
MPRIELTPGTIEYEDTGGGGPVVVLLHGLLQNATVWRKIVPALSPTHRVITPTLPYGGHRIPMDPSVPLGPDAVNDLVVEFVERLGLRDVTLVESDCGRAQTVAARRPDLLARLVLISCEAFDNYPPALPGKMLVFACRTPGVLPLLVRMMGLGFVRHGPTGLGALVRRRIPDDIVDGWWHGLRTDPAIRADFRRYGRAVRGSELLEAVPGLRAFDKPALVVWGADDRMMPREHGSRLAALLPGARLVVIDDSGTLVQEDQPQRLIAELTGFLAESTPPGVP